LGKNFGGASTSSKVGEALRWASIFLTSDTT